MRDARRRRDAFKFSVLDLLLLSLLVAFIVNSSPITDAVPRPPANPTSELVIKLTWDMADDADVDLWMRGPHESEPVGYKNKHGVDLNLAWDDLGRSGDPDSRNVEFMDAEKAAAGEYIVNAVLYTDRDGRLPVHVIAEARYSGDHVLQAEGDLVRQGDEITLMRFRIDKNGNLIYVNNLFRSLFNGGRL